jgi:RNA polymerase sigma-70 factor, ECF subfamily
VLQQPSTFADTLAAARRGDEWAIAVLWTDLNPRLLRYLRVRHRDSVDDVASETWVRVNRSLSRFQGSDVQFRAWFFTVARSASIDWHRGASRRPAVVGNLDLIPDCAAADDPAEVVLDTIDTDGALALLGRLPAAQAEVILLRVVAGLDAERVGRIVGKPAGTVRVLQHRGLRRLAQLLTSERSETSDMAR